MSVLRPGRFRSARTVQLDEGDVEILGVILKSRENTARCAKQRSLTPDVDRHRRYRRRRFPFRAAGHERCGPGVVLKPRLIAVLLGIPGHRSAKSRTAVPIARGWCERHASA